MATYSKIDKNAVITETISISEWYDLLRDFSEQNTFYKLLRSGGAAHNAAVRKGVHEGNFSRQILGSFKYKWIKGFIKAGGKFEERNDTGRFVEWFLRQRGIYRFEDVAKDPVIKRLRCELMSCYYDLFKNDYRLETTGKKPSMSERFVSVSDAEYGDIREILRDSQINVKFATLYLTIMVYENIKGELLEDKAIRKVNDDLSCEALRCYHSSQKLDEGKGIDALIKDRTGKIKAVIQLKTRRNLNSSFLNDGWGGHENIIHSMKAYSESLESKPKVALVSYEWINEHDSSELLNDKEKIIYK